MKYSDYVAHPKSGKMIYKPDVQNISKYLTGYSREAFEGFREQLEDVHGYNYYRDAQDLAFMALFSSLKEYNDLLKND